MLEKLAMRSAAKISSSTVKMPRSGTPVRLSATAAPLSSAQSNPAISTARME